MSFWDGFMQSLVGKPSGSFDPYEKDREAKMGALKQGMADYDKMMSTPGGAFPAAYRQQMLDESDERTAAANPGAGQSGFLADRQARNRNDINMKLVDRELGMLDKQRDYNQALLTSSQPMQQSPAEGGILQAVGGNLAGRGANAAGDAIFGNPEQDKKDKQSKDLAGRQPANARQGGMGVYGEDWMRANS